VNGALESIRYDVDMTVIPMPLDLWLKEAPVGSVPAKSQEQAHLVFGLVAQSLIYRMPVLLLIYF